MAPDDTLTLRIESDDDSEELEVPAGLLTRIGEEGESPPEVLANVAFVGLTQQVHGAVHHAPGEPDDELEAVEAEMLELFEERFGMTFAEMTGHSH